MISRAYWTRKIPCVDPLILYNTQNTRYVTAWQRAFKIFHCYRGKHVEVRSRTQMTASP
jgi:hypothetical protein